jgi:D-alanyl-lipoteichoic acid acyltransferase DltB (MBOAT superfamily)
MSFVSPEFLVFFVIITTLYFLLPFRWRWLFLLIVSYIFYGYWNPIYTVLMASVTLVSFGSGWWLGHLTNPTRRRVVLSLSLVATFSGLFIFKYLMFFNQSAAALFNAAGWTYPNIALDILLPVGISFYTFQAVGYIIDVYRRDLPVEPHLGMYALYISFFPQLVAGPIERAGNILPQFREQFRFDEARVVEGLRLILWGVFKKVVIADRLALYVNGVYNDANDYAGLPLIVATIFFAFQIYCDFSAYSDIAIGVAKVMGFNLMENFRQPYLSLSVHEFWRRWHISLSSWFRDYLYIPLGGSRVAFGRVLLNLFIVFVVSGLWHGANWTFVIWGALHGVYVVAESLIARWGGRWTLPAVFRWAIMISLVCFAWIFFRANSLDDANYVVANLFNFTTESEGLLDPFSDALFPAEWELAISAALIGVLLLHDWVDARWGLLPTLRRSPLLIRWAWYYGLAFGIALSLWIYVTGTEEFIYFQF